MWIPLFYAKVCWNRNDIPFSSKDSKTPSTAKSISEPIVMEQYLVIADYTKEGANEIDLIANEVIDVVEKNDTGTGDIEMLAPHVATLCSHIM